MPLYPRSVSEPLESISNFDLYHGSGGLTQLGASFASATWVSANRAYACPLYLADDVIALKLWHANGAAVSGNICVAVYNEAWVRVVTSGSTAQAGTSTVQSFDVTDTPLRAGRYYIAAVLDNTTGTSLMWGSGGVEARSMGMVVQDTAFPLPDPFVAAQIAGFAVPLMGISCRALM